MNPITDTKNTLQEGLQQREPEKGTSDNHGTADELAELERGVFAALETYSNVHRGSGHKSIVTTFLFEKAREIVLEYLGLNKREYLVIFCSPRRAVNFMKLLEPESFQIVSSLDLGLSLGVRALAVKRKALPGGIPFETGGGTTKLVSRDWVIWADAPDKFEAGTPAIINIIAFAKALRMMRQSGKDILIGTNTEKQTATEILYHDELEKYAGHELLGKLKQTLIGRGVQVPTVEGEKPFINLDNSASTPTFAPVWKAFQHAWRQPEKLKQEIVHGVKSICAEVLGAPSDTYDVIFTSNTTEAINLVAESLSIETEDYIQPIVLNTILEHSSNDLPWRKVAHYSPIRLPVDDEGFIELIELETLLSTYNQENKYENKRIVLVAVSGASNVLGVCNNLKEISRIVHQYGAHLLVDAAQLVAHRKVDMEECRIDYLTFSAHKVYAPFGTGVLIVKKGLLNFTSAEMGLILSSGDENAAGIAALGKSLVLLQRIGMDVIREEEQALTRKALLGMAKIPSLKIYGLKNPDSPKFSNRIGVIVFSMKSIMPKQIANELALRSGIGVRYGCHCAHIIIKHLLKVSPFLERFQHLIQILFPRLRFPGLVRISFGIENSEEDVDKLIEVLGQIAGSPRASSDKYSSSGNNRNPNITKFEVQQQVNDFVKTSALKVYSQL